MPYYIPIPCLYLLAFLVMYRLPHFLFILRLVSLRFSCKRGGDELTV